MKNVMRNAGYWLAGTLLAIVGVIVARGIGPHAAAPLRLPLTAAGQLLALAGLFLLCVGVSRRLKRDSTRPQSEISSS